MFYRALLASAASRTGHRIRVHTIQQRENLPILVSRCRAPEHQGHFSSTKHRTGSTSAVAASGSPFGLSLTSLLVTGHDVIIAMTPSTSPIPYKNRLHVQCTNTAGSFSEASWPEHCKL